MPPPLPGNEIWAQQETPATKRTISTRGIVLLDGEYPFSVSESSPAAGADANQTSQNHRQRPDLGTGYGFLEEDPRPEKCTDIAG